MDYTTTTTATDLGNGMSTGALVFWVIVLIVIAVLLIIANWKIFTKAGKPGWAVFVPGYNYVVTLEVANMAIWHVLIMLYVPLAAIVYWVIIPFKLAKAFGKGTEFGFLLWLLPVIGYPILAFGSAKYEG